MDKSNQTNISRTKINDEVFYKISNCDSMREFFMSIVSDSDHWMFIASNGGLTAGRRNAESSLFPYYTDDKITESAEITGSKTILLIEKNGTSQRWEPFSDVYDGMYSIQRNLYKNEYGNKIMFEEINRDLQLTFRYQWNSSDTYGFVKKSSIINRSQENVTLQILDGIQNILPCGVGSDLQNSASNLVDAYKRSELDLASGLGIFALSALIVDKAEPSESLKANVAWSRGLADVTYLLSSLQLSKFRKGASLVQETDVKAEKGGFFVHSKTNLSASGEKEWLIVANVNLNHAAVTNIAQEIQGNDQILMAVEKDILAGSQNLIKLNASSDALQMTADVFRDARHFNNVLFNIMRGGIFDDGYSIEKNDFEKYLSKANRAVFELEAQHLSHLGEKFTLSDLKIVAVASDNVHFKRLCHEYLPLKFSRRHGDPSRPWNKFSINTRDEKDGSKILDYEGNWRDIFQNWEALSHSFPHFVGSMICKFLNATTFDGYNPYRVTKDGFDWETIEPDDPWSYIGYWGDHQIIYLLKFLEFSEGQNPGQLAQWFNEDVFVYANVPYKIKPYDQIIENPKDTIDFDLNGDESIREHKLTIGADGALLMLENNAIHQVNFLEKILATLLAKVSNFIPEGGIWMNTQRPEWNDANNALVGNGVSMVTLCYMRRFAAFFADVLTAAQAEEVLISSELHAYFSQVYSILDTNKDNLSGAMSDNLRREIMDGLGQAGSDYRWGIYKNAFSGDRNLISIQNIREFCNALILYFDHSIASNKRSDGMYHAYNLLTLKDEQTASISYLSEMLEGQVAVLSSGFLSAEDSVQVLDGLKNSALFREDQYSYVLYPNKDLPKFAQKNIISEAQVARSKYLQQLIAANDKEIIEQSVTEQNHFNGSFKNANDVLAAMGERRGVADPNQEEKEIILQIFEEVFDHKSFTGRSGTFFGYEGLGSIYWHMVSKLQLAVQESCLHAIGSNAPDALVGRLLEHYYEINEGIGVHKSPTLYGAFPIDPYSHTPAGKGAQQPGMTGQVKEDILSRFGELGVFVKNGRLYFNPCLLRKDEFLTEDKSFTYIDVTGQANELKLKKASLCFTYCQLPIIYKLAAENRLKINYSNNTESVFESLQLEKGESQKVFNRSNEIHSIEVYLKEDLLK